MVPASFRADHLFQELLEDIFKGLIQAEADRLPGGGMAGKRLDLCGQVIAAGRTLEAFVAD